jgi:hypothetical protein
MSTTRRKFLKSAGAITVAFSWSVPSVLAQQAARPSLPGSLNTNRMLDGWIRINANGTVTVFTGKCELGQGILTALAQIAADELDVAYERIEMVSADTARTPDEGMTAGSQSVENSGTALRFACAERARSCSSWPGPKLGVPVAKADRDGRHRFRLRQDQLLGARKGSEHEARGFGPGEAEARRAAQGGRPQHPPPRHTVQDDRRPRATCRTCGCPAWCSAVWYGRPPTALDFNRSMKAAVKAMPGVVGIARDGSFLGRRGRARGAGDQGGAGDARVGESGPKRPTCRRPCPRSSTTCSR